jgi:polysaccharide chain length determinant protein (PEP-CTERM system associated)
MIGHRALTFDDYVAIARRRWWMLVVPAALGTVVVYLASLFIPNRYTSETLVLITQPTVPENYVSSVVREDLNQRLAAMQNQILSRSRLQPVIERFGLYQKDSQRVPMEDLVTRLRNSITVQPVQPMAQTTSTRLPGFTVKVTAEAAKLAQQICSEVTSMFVDESVHNRQQEAEDTTQFLSTQLDNAKAKLDEQDAKLAEFKRRNIGRLPDNEQTNLNLLTGLNTQLEASTEALDRAQQDKSYSEALLAEEVATWQDSQTGHSPQTLEQQLADLQKQLGTLQARYTSNHPDVIKTKNDIAELKKEIAEANLQNPGVVETKNANPAAEPPQLQALRAQIDQYQQAIRGRTAQQEQLQAQIKDIQARVQASPMVEQEFTELTRDHQTALEFYNDLLKKRGQSAMSADLERHQEGEQFRVLDPANLPEKPSFPDRPQFALGGFGGGLALGAGLLLLLEMRDTTLRTQRDAELLLEAPVLTLIPTFGRGPAKAREIRLSLKA